MSCDQLTVNSNQFENQESGLGRHPQDTWGYFYNRLTILPWHCDMWKVQSGILMIRIRHVFYLQNETFFLPAVFRCRRQADKLLQAAFPRMVEPPIPKSMFDLGWFSQEGEPIINVIFHLPNTCLLQETSPHQNAVSPLLPKSPCFIVKLKSHIVQEQKGKIYPFEMPRSVPSGKLT